MSGLKPVTNANGEDITAMLLSAARSADLEPWYLLACIQAESGRNPHAERYGYAGTDAVAKAALASGDLTAYQAMINAAWSDISFGYGQQTVATIAAYGVGNGSKDYANVLAVRNIVWNDPQRDLNTVARRLKGHLDGVEGDLLRALVVYNSGGDNLTEEWYISKYRKNITNYREAIAFAEAFKEDDRDAALRSLDALWGTAEDVGRLAPEREGAMKVWIGTLKDYIQAH